MQDKTINNALLALRKAGGHQGKLAEVLLDMRGVPLPLSYNFHHSRRGEVRRLCLEMLREGPKTTGQITDVFFANRPELGREIAGRRIRVALKRLLDRGTVRWDGEVWRLAQ